MRRFLPLVPILVLPWTASAGDKEPIILKHDGWVAAVAFAPDGKTLASAGADKVVRLWDVGTWKPKGVLKGHTDCVCAIVFTPKGDRLVSGSFDSSVRSWDVQAVKPIDSVKQRGPVTAVYYEPGNFISVLITAGLDGVVRAHGLEELGPLIEHKSWVNGLAIHKLGIATASSDGTVGLLTEFKDGKFAKPTFFEGGAGEVRCVAFNPDGKMLAAGNRYGTVRIWDVASKKEIKTITGHMGEVWSIAFSPDGKTLAAVDTEWKKPSKIKLYDTTTWKERAALDCPGEILSIAYSPKGDWLAAGCWDKTVRLFSLAAK